MVEQSPGKWKITGLILAWRNAFFSLSPYLPCALCFLAMLMRFDKLKSIYKSNISLIFFTNFIDQSGNDISRLKKSLCDLDVKLFSGWKVVELQILDFTREFKPLFQVFCCLREQKTAHSYLFFFFLFTCFIGSRYFAEFQPCIIKKCFLLLKVDLTEIAQKPDFNSYHMCAIKGRSWLMAIAWVHT